MLTHLTDCNNIASAIFIFPMLALLGHMLVPPGRLGCRRVWQSLTTLIWLLLIIVLAYNSRQTYIIMMGNWPSPFGIAFSFDRLSCAMLLVFSITIFSISNYSYQDHDLRGKTRTFYTGFWLLTIGITGVICTADLFNLYVWFEVILLSAFILLSATDKTNPKIMIHYALINITGTLLMLLAIALLYGAFASLSYVTIAKAVNLANPLTTPILCLLLIAIGIKGAIFPLYFWLPKAYPYPSYSSTMLLSSLITKAVMVVLLRFFCLWHPLSSPFLHRIIIIAALATMFFGVMGAANEFRFKRILSFHIISQLGYILLAIALPMKIAVIACVYFLWHNIIVKTLLFMIAGVVEQQLKTDDLHQLPKLIKANKPLAISFFIAAISLAGIPPSSGFWGKFLIIKSAIASHHYYSSVMAIVVSLLTLYSMMKIWRYGFCESKRTTPSIAKRLTICYPIMAIVPLLLITIIMGIMPDTFLVWFSVIAKQLQTPTNYIHMILGS